MLEEEVRLRRLVLDDTALATRLLLSLITGAPTNAAGRGARPLSHSDRERWVTGAVALFFTAHGRRRRRGTSIATRAAASGVSLRHTVSAFTICWRAILRSWFERLTEIAEVAKRQLFFVGGAPRSGTTWLQQMLDCHPDISCRGEGLFLQQLATPMERLIAERSGSIDAKNRQVFRHAGGYPLPAPDDSEFLTATAILLALHRQSEGRQCSAIGEKTPENVFFFPRLKSMFPGAKLICIARDPRDVLTSAWHFFHSAAAGEDEVAAKMEFVRGALRR